MNHAQNFEKAKKLLKRTLKLFQADGGIGIAQDQHQKILSYEFIINLNKVPINFGTCLTTYELLEKSKLYHELVKDSIRQVKLVNATKHLLFTPSKNQKAA